jgi:hypothetical protein
MRRRARRLIPGRFRRFSPESRALAQRYVGKSRRGASFLAVSLFFVPIVAEQ